MVETKLKSTATEILLGEKKRVYLEIVFKQPQIPGKTNFLLENFSWNLVDGHTPFLFL